MRRRWVSVWVFAVLCSCGPATQPTIEVEIRGVTSAIIANQVSADDVELQLFFRRAQPEAGAAIDDRRIAPWPREDPFTLRVQLPPGEISSFCIEARMPRLCAGARVGHQVIGEGTATQMFSSTFERTARVTIDATPTTRPVICPSS
jgi:hypothetical protein